MIPIYTDFEHIDTDDGYKSTITVATVNRRWWPRGHVVALTIYLADSKWCDMNTGKPLPRQKKLRQLDSAADMRATLARAVERRMRAKSVERPGTATLSNPHLQAMLNSYTDSLLGTPYVGYGAPLSGTVSANTISVNKDSL